MSIPNLPVDFKDDILNTGVNQKRKYQQTYNSDGSVSFEDVTAYQQKGSDFGAQQVNETNGAVNNIYAERIVDLDELELVTEPGFFVDALAVKELNSNNETHIFENRFATGIVMRQGNVKRLRLTNSTVGFKSGTAYNLGTLPAEYCPIEQLAKFIVIAGSADIAILGRLIISTAGSVTFTPYADRGDGAVINIDETYI